MTKTSQLDKIIALLHRSSFTCRFHHDKDRWDSLVTSQIDTYPVEDSVFIKDKRDELPELRSSLTESTLSHLPDILQLVDYTLPFSIVQRGQTFPKAPKHEDKFLFDSNVQTEIVLQYFCSPSSSLQSFDHWIQQRLLWWRRNAANPSQISSSEIETIDDETSKAYIQCQFPWGPNIVEEIISKGSNPVHKLQQTTGIRLQCKNGKKFYTPHIIECSTVLEHCLVTCLCDSYTENVVKRGDKSSVVEKFNLSPKIAPYKISVVSVSKSRYQEIQEVASYINKDLRNSGIDVFHAKDSLSATKQFKRNDLMGIPYTAILDEETLVSGTIDLRNKDTTLQEKIHITHLKEIILKNIQF